MTGIAETRPLSPEERALIPLRMWLDRSLKKRIEPLIRPIQERVSFCEKDYTNLYTKIANLEKETKSLRNEISKQNTKHKNLHKEMIELRREIKVLRKGL